MLPKLSNTDLAERGLRIVNNDEIKTVESENEIWGASAKAFHLMRLKAKWRSLKLTIQKPIMKFVFYKVEDHYEIVKKIGSGTYSIVFLALDRLTQKEVAIKTSKGTSFSKKLKEEYELLKHLDHIWIPKVYDFKTDEANNKSYLIMEYFEGSNLSDHVSEVGILDLGCALKILNSIFNTIDYLHSKGVCHRDLKPANVIVNKEFEIKLIDYNISKCDKNYLFNINNESLKIVNIIAMTQIGSPLFAAPEVYSSMWYTEKIDIWGAGIIFFYSLFDSAETFSSILQTKADFNVQNNGLPWKSDITKSTLLHEKVKDHPNKAIANFLSQLLEVDPELRPSAKECIELLEIVKESI